MITVVYWDGGEKKIIKDFEIKSTSLDFTIYNQTSVPPFILYLETQYTLEPILYMKKNYQSLQFHTRIMII